MPTRNVFVAGGTSGINLAIAERFAREKATVCVLSRRREKVDAAVEQLSHFGEAAGWVGDVRDYTAIEAAFAAARDRFGELDVVVSGAAGNFLAAAHSMSANAFKAVVDIDLLGTFNVFRASFAHLKKPGASLIAVTAPQGQMPAIHQAHACAAKAGVNMLTKCLAMEWGPIGVRVNALSPGPVRGTEGIARLVPTAGMEQAVTAMLPLRRFAEFSDIADAAAFLADKSSAYITGSIIECDGGLHPGDASQDAFRSPVS
jgi:NAD(P)-dependent dehydrogenase (short-subunit alcohol dehydrogenase family)